MSSPNILPNIRTSCGQPNSFNVVAAANSLGRSVRPHYATSVIDDLQHRLVTLPSCVCQNFVNDASCFMSLVYKHRCVVDCCVSICGMPSEIVPGNSSGVYPGEGRRSSLQPAFPGRRIQFRPRTIRSNCGAVSHDTTIQNRGASTSDAVTVNEFWTESVSSHSSTVSGSLKPPVMMSLAISRIPFVTSGSFHAPSCTTN